MRKGNEPERTDRTTCPTNPNVASRVYQMKLSYTSNSSEVKYWRRIVRTSGWYDFVGERRGAVCHRLCTVHLQLAGKLLVRIPMPDTCRLMVLVHVVFDTVCFLFCPLRVIGVCRVNRCSCRECVRPATKYCSAFGPPTVTQTYHGLNWLKLQTPCKSPRNSD